MATFTIVTDDESLVARVRAGIARTDWVFRVPGGFDARIPRPEAGQADIVVVDARRLGAADAVGAVVELRHRIPEDRRVVCVVSIQPASRIAVVTSRADRDVDFVLATPAYPEHLGMVLRAIANDLSLTVASAAALDVLSEVHKPRAAAVAGVVLASGCSIRKVAAVAAELGRSTTHLREELGHESGAHACDVIRHAQCTYALALARRAALTVAQIAAFCKLGKVERFHRHCETHLRARVKTMALQWPDIDLRAFLLRALNASGLDGAKNSGGGAGARSTNGNHARPTRDKRRMRIPLMELPFRNESATIAA